MAEGGRLVAPGEAARRLGIAVSTLRIYSVKLADVLSAEAGRPASGPDGRPGVRRYRAADLEVLAQAKELLGRGLTYEQAAQELGARQAAGQGRAVGRARRARGVLASDLAILLEPLKASLEQAVAGTAAWQALAEERRREGEALRARIETLEAELAAERRARPWWRRLLG
jgi:DNA-binding transcriptional MerR regulator